MIRYDDMGTLGEIRKVFAGLNVPDAVAPVMSKAGSNMKNAARDRALKTPHLTVKGTNVADYANQIMFKKDKKLAVEVFALKRSQGSLAAILEYGYGPNMAVPHFMPALDGEIWPTAYWIAKVLEAEFNK